MYPRLIKLKTRQIHQVLDVLWTQLKTLKNKRRINYINKRIKVQNKTGKALNFIGSAKDDKSYRFTMIFWNSFDIQYSAIPYRASTGPEQGFPCAVFPHREKPVFNSVPRWWKQVFPCEKYYTGKTLFSLQRWVCSGLTVFCKSFSRNFYLFQLETKTVHCLQTTMVSITPLQPERGFSAVFTFQLDYTKRYTFLAPHCHNGSCRYVRAMLSLSFLSIPFNRLPWHCSAN